MDITITSQIPIGSGMGSSAALSAALLGALMKVVKNIWNPVKINELAYEAEKIAHGNPSGADNTAVVFGGLVWYRKEFDFLKSIWNLPITSYKFPKFIIINTGKPRESTKMMVEKVAGLYKKNSKKFGDLFYRQETLTKELLMSFRTGDINKMSNVIMEGERNLEQMEVVSHYTQNIIRKIEKIGGVAKICGAGGFLDKSGIMLCYHKDISKIKTIADSYNLECYDIKLGEEGVRIELSNNLINTNNPITQ